MGESIELLKNKDTLKPSCDCQVRCEHMMQLSKNSSDTPQGIIPTWALTLSNTQAHTPVSWQSLRSYPNACGCSPGSLWGQTWRRLWCAYAGVGYSLTWCRRSDMIQLEANNSPPTVPGFVVLGSIWGKIRQGQKWLHISVTSKTFPLLMTSHAGLNNKVFQRWQSNNFFM